MHDLRFAFRQLAKSPGFTAVAVLSLALGIGAATALFSVLQALVLDPFPYPEAEQIAYLRSNTGQPLSIADFKDIREKNTCFAELGGYVATRLNFGTEPAESLPAIRCTAAVLRALAVSPALGRWLEDADEEPGAAPVAVISHSLWLRAFEGDPAIVGRIIRLDDQPTEVVGVMPAEFEFTSPWYAGSDYQMWTPLKFDGAIFSERGSHWFLGLGRLKPGVTVATADAEIKTIGAWLTQEYPETNTRKPMLVRSLRDEITRDTASGLQPLSAAVALLMLVACANVAGLLLARGTRRQPEFGVRIAMGASRGALIRQLLNESVLLGLLGSAAGILFATWGVVAVRQLIPATLIIEARRAAIDLNGWVLLFAVVVGLITGILAGLYPALTAARTPVAATLGEGGRTQTGSRLRQRFLRQLVGAQIAVTVVLVYAGTLFTASYLNIFRTNRPLDTHQVLTAEVAPLGERYHDVAARVRFWNELIQRVQSLPGVEHAAMTTKLPLEGGSNFDALVDDQVFDPEIRRPLVEHTGVSPRYFPAMGLGWLRGQVSDLTVTQGAAAPVAINQTMAHSFWPDTDPIGRHVFINHPESPFTFEVVGVVDDVRQWGAESSPRPELYYVCTLDGTPEEALPEYRAYLIVRATGDARRLVPALRDELTRLDAGLPLSRIRTMADVLRDAGSRRRLSFGLINLFTVIALVLAAIGIYGTLSYVLAERTREIGVRIAVGAQRGQILGLVVRQTGLWLIGGLVPGLAISAACSFALRSMIYGISPLDPVALLLGAVIVAVVMIVACLAPARRATRINPVEALRAE